MEHSVQYTGHTTMSGDVRWLTRNCSITSLEKEPLLGVAPAHREALDDVSRLQADIEAADCSRTVYVPLLPENASLRISYGAARSLPYVAGVNLWLWSDEATVEGVEIPGLGAFRKTVSKEAAPGPNAPSSESPSQKSLRNFKNPLNESARSLR